VQQPGQQWDPGHRHPWWSDEGRGRVRDKRIGLG
jgi:hypothetical protein